MGRPSRTRRGAVVALVLGSVVAIGGLVAVSIPIPQQASFGWFAYAPLSAATFAATGVFLGPTAIAGLVALVVGVGLAAFAAGWMLARRHTTRDSNTPTAGS